MNDNNFSRKLGEILGAILVITLVACVSIAAVALTIKLMSLIF